MKLLKSDGKKSIAPQTKIPLEVIAPATQAMMNADAYICLTVAKNDKGELNVEFFPYIKESDFDMFKQVVKRCHEQSESFKQIISNNLI